MPSLMIPQAGVPGPSQFWHATPHPPRARQGPTRGMWESHIVRMLFYPKQTGDRGGGLGPRGEEERSGRVSWTDENPQGLLFFKVT